MSGPRRSSLVIFLGAKGERLPFSREVSKHGIRIDIEFEAMNAPAGTGGMQQAVTARDIDQLPARIVQGISDTL